MINSYLVPILYFRRIGPVCGAWLTVIKAFGQWTLFVLEFVARLKEARC